jgi:class 3 adenylate cyclase
MQSQSKIDQYLTDYINQQRKKSRNEIESRIWREYGREGAIFILDMADFSLSTRTHGIIYYLSLIKKMQKTVEPIIKNRSGHLVKFEADNAYAFFSTTENALQASIDIKIAIDAVNTKYPDDLDILVSIGIDHGKFIFLEEDHDFFGDPVNIASKLGEDVAEKGEILITEKAYRMMPEIPYRSEPLLTEVSGITISSHKIFYP